MPRSPKVVSKEQKGSQWGWGREPRVCSLK